MAELAYPVDHPAHPANKGKKFSTPPTPFSHDYLPGHPARGGVGQAVPLEAGSEEPCDGYKHLHGLPGDTLGERQRAFAALPGKEQEERAKWNADGIPAAPEEGE